MRNGARKRRECPISIKFVCIAMVMLFSALGVSYAQWADGVLIFGTVSTGNLDMVFEQQGCDNRLSISGDEKTIELFLEGATPLNPPIIILFEISNQGTVPAYLDLIATEETGELRVMVSIEDHYIAPGSKRKGEITVMVLENAEENRPYTFLLGLRFQQSLGASE